MAARAIPGVGEEYVEIIARVTSELEEVKAGPPT